MCPPELLTLPSRKRLLTMSTRLMDHHSIGAPSSCIRASADSATSSSSIRFPDLEVYKIIHDGVISAHTFFFLFSSFLADMVNKALSARAFLCSLVAISVQLVNGQDDEPASSWPHAYPGMPAGDFSPEWQNCACRFLFSPYEMPHSCMSFSHRLPSDGEAHKRHLGFGQTELGWHHSRRTRKSP